MGMSASVGIQINKKARIKISMFMCGFSKWLKRKEIGRVGIGPVTDVGKNKSL